MSDGTLSIRRRQVKASESTIGSLDSADILLSGQFAGVGQGHVKGKGKEKSFGDANELMVERRRRKRLRDYDRLLKAFKYSAALDAVLKKVIDTLAVLKQGLSISSRTFLRLPHFPLYGN
jgi:U3 small nucleolar RNA-associated protein 15